VSPDQLTGQRLAPPAIWPDARCAARDLEIRAAGSLLGTEQHGHLRAVGFPQ